MLNKPGKILNNAIFPFSIKDSLLVSLYNSWQSLDNVNRFAFLLI